MTVFPLIRLVGLKAATASSRVAMLPMFVCSRPSRTRWTISPSWARSDSTTKSTVRPSVGRASGADDVGARQSCELRHHRPDCAGRAVCDYALPRLKVAVLEQSLPRGEARDWQARAHREVDVARERREVARLDGYILRQGAVAMPVGEAEHSLSYRQSRRAVAESGDHSGQLVAGDRRCSVTVAAIGPGRGPRQLSRDESRRMNLNDDVVYRCRRLGPLHQLHPGRSRSLVRHHYRLHGIVSSVIWRKCCRYGCVSLTDERG